MTLYIGIDPGKQGAIASLDDAGNYQVLDLPYIGDEVDAHWIWDTVGLWSSEYGDTLVVVEQQVPIPVFRKMRKGEPVLGPDGKPEMMRPGAKSTFLLGKNYGAIVTAIRLVDPPVRYDLPTPRMWKDAFGLGASKEDSMKRAEHHFPDAQLHTPRGRALDGRAEALLLADFGRRVTYT
jgi:hypothetical protein